MPEKSNYSVRDGLSADNIRKLEDIKRLLPPENSESVKGEISAAAPSILLDETAKDLPVTEFSESKPLEPSGIRLDEVALLRERSREIDKAKLKRHEKEQTPFVDVKQQVASLSEQEKEAIRKSDDYKLLAETNEGIVKERVTPDPAVDALMESIFKEKPVDPLASALFLLDQEKNLENLSSVSVNKNELTHNITKELAGESQYYENLREPSGATPQKKEVARVESPKERIDKKPETKELEPNFNGKVFEELCQWSIKGMSDRDIRARLLVAPKDFQGPEWIRKLMNEPGFTDTVNLFLKQRRDHNFKPAAIIGAEIIIENIKSGEVEQQLSALNTATEQASEVKLRELAREVWDNFVYTGKKLHNPKTRQDEFIPDLDSKVAIWLFEQAGVKGIAKKNVVEPGKLKIGTTMLDVGVESDGVRLHEGIKLTKKDPEGLDLKSRPTTVFDNHLTEPDLIDTSAARSVMSVLRDLNLLRMDSEQWEKARLLVEMTVLDDNSSMINNREQFESSAHTLRGLHRYFKSGNELYQAVSELWHSGMSIDQLLDAPVSEGFDDKYNLGKFTDKWVPKEKNPKVKEKKSVWVGAMADQQFAIDQAKRLFDKSEDALRSEGRMLDSKKLGKCLIFINEETPRAGHDAVKAYFGQDSSYLVYTSGKNSFLVNSHNKETQLKYIFGHLPQGIFVRGNVFIKPKSERDLLKVSPRDLLLPLVDNEKEADDFLARVHDRKSGKPEKKIDNKPRVLSGDNPESSTPSMVTTEVEPVDETKLEQPTAQENKKEKWVDVMSGIEFTRSLNDEEIKSKTSIDDRTFNLLLSKAKAHPMYERAADKIGFEETFINSGFKHEAIVNYLKKEYLEHNLPVK